MSSFRSKTADARSSSRSRPTKNDSLQIQMEKVAQRNLLVPFEARAGQRISVPANHVQCHHIVQIYASRLLGKVGQKWFESEEEMLYQKRLPELREAPRIVLQELFLKETAGRNLLRERASIRLTPKIGQMFDGVPRAIVDKDQARKRIDHQPHSSSPTTSTKGKLDAGTTS